ncbi:MAG: M23 family metallopeptidase [Bacteroidales bacterium]|jgi:murein DD-endopeptidase MepM/ murein hydrolase activator NlpD|nr:M23 family metallopeptidase [Bacteroidales bacterium]
MTYRKILALALMVSAICSADLSAQKPMSANVDTRSASRKLADSLYEVHTLRKIRKADTAHIVVADAIPPTYISEKEAYPSATLYQNTWFCDKVKIPNFQFQQIPDQITIRLTGKDKKSNFHFPCNKGVKSSNYGWRWGKAHAGIDIALNVGEPVYAAFDGVVRVAKVNGGYGKMILIRHYNNLETLYGHLSEIKVKSGQVIKAGDVIGLSGNTGHSTGPHLHFECRLLYACFDPEWIFDVEKRCIKSDILHIDKSYFGVQSAEQISKQSNSKSPLTKVNRTFDDKPYMSIQTIIENKNNKTKK